MFIILGLLSQIFIQIIAIENFLINRGDIFKIACKDTSLSSQKDLVGLCNTHLYESTDILCTTIYLVKKSAKTMLRVKIPTYQVKEEYFCERYEASGNIVNHMDVPYLLDLYSLGLIEFEILNLQGLLSLHVKRELQIQCRATFKFNIVTYI